MNCPQCHLAVGADQYALGEPELAYDAQGHCIGQDRWLWVHCDHCGPCEVRLRDDDRFELVLFKRPARTSADANRILSKLPHIDTAPPGTARSKRSYQPAEVAT